MKLSRPFLTIYVDALHSGARRLTFHEAEVEFRMAAERFSANPGLSAVLKLEVLAKQKKEAR